MKHQFLILAISLLALTVGMTSCSEKAKATPTISTTSSTTGTQLNTTSDSNKSKSLTKTTKKTTRKTSTAKRNGQIIKNAANVISVTGKTILRGATMEMDIDRDGKKEYFELSVKQVPRAIALKGQYGSNLIYDLPDDNEEIFGEYGDLDDDAVLEIGVYDFNGDGKMEVILAIRGAGVVYATVFKVRNAEEDSFKPIGSLTGQWELWLENNHIYAPYGTQGLFDDYICDGQQVYSVQQ